MDSEALTRFEKSMAIGYEEWHDGIGYDLTALDELTESEKRFAEKLLIPRATNDWRDLEALDRLGTPGAIRAILDARRARDPDIRLRAHRYGPEPTAEEWESSILALLKVADLYSGLTQVLDCAVEHPSSAVQAMLWTRVRDPESGVAYHCAAALCCIHGVLDSMYDDRYRPLFLRLVAKASEDRTQAVEELAKLID